MTKRDIKAEAAAWRKAKAERINAIEILLAVSPALRGMVGDYPRLALVTGELSDPAAGAHRVTYFGTDGPYGHATRPSMRRIAEEIEDTLQPPYESLTEDEVIAWTSTPEFIDGAKRVAYVQAENTYSWLAQKANIRFDERMATSDRARAISRETGDIEKATAFLHEKIAELPKQNPRVAGFVMNPPPWVTGVLADSYETLAKKAPPRWLPQISELTSRGKKVSGKFVEFGCGKYGCVLPTLDPEIVLKVTSDDSEAMFAEHLAPDLVEPVTVEYPMVASLSAKHEGRPIYLLWRQAAEHVGKLDDVLGEAAGDLIDNQHTAATAAYHAIRDGHSKEMVRARISTWLESCERIVRQREFPSLRDLFQKIITVYEDQRILFGDIHTGNIGMVHGRWVVTDPGNVAVLDPD